MKLISSQSRKLSENRVFVQDKARNERNTGGVHVYFEDFLELSNAGLNEKIILGQPLRGSVLIIALFVTTMLMGLGAAILLMTTNEQRTTTIQKNANYAQQNAEIGLNKAIYDLRQDCVNDTSNFSFADGSINSMSIGPDTSNYFSVSAYTPNTINAGSYTVQFKNVTGDKDAIWVKSTGTIDGTSQSVEAYLKVEVVSPWHTAIFGGAGRAGTSDTVVLGDIGARGSVILLGDNIATGDFALDLGTGYKIGNNYSGIPVNFSSKVPSLPTVKYNSESVETLEASLRVKKGEVSLSGSGYVGEADVSSNAYKETLDATYVSNGWGGSQGANNVSSDNGATDGYDLGDAITFPDMSATYQAYANYPAYLEANSLVLSDAADLAEMASIKPNSNFGYTNGTDSISMDGSGNLAIAGKVYVKGGDVLFDKNGGDETISYTGTGVIYSTGDVIFKANLLTTGNSSFPSNIIGFMAGNDVQFNRTTASTSEVMGLFYAVDRIHFDKSVHVAGTVVGNFIEGESNGSVVYQVPDTVTNLPAGLIGTTATCIVKVISWRKI